MRRSVHSLHTGTWESHFRCLSLQVQHPLGNEGMVAVSPVMVGEKEQPCYCSLEVVELFERHTSSYSTAVPWSNRSVFREAHSEALRLALPEKIF